MSKKPLVSGIIIFMNGANFLQEAIEEEDFVAMADDDNARIHFDLGNSDIGIELSSVHFHVSPIQQSLDRME